MLTLKQVAERTGYSVSHLRYLIRNQKLKAQTFGKSYAINEADLATLPPRSRRGQPRKS